MSTLTKKTCLEALALVRRKKKAGPSNLQCKRERWRRKGAGRKKDKRAGQGERGQINGGSAIERLDRGGGTPGKFLRKIAVESNKKQREDGKDHDL